jgi:hypothetical protein
MKLTFNLFYRLASGLILLGFLMLVQPFTLELFSRGFLVLLAGIVLFVVVDHLPGEEADEDAG